MSVEQPAPVITVLVDGRPALSGRSIDPRVLAMVDQARRRPNRVALVVGAVFAVFAALAVLAFLAGAQ